MRIFDDSPSVRSKPGESTAPSQFAALRPCPLEKLTGDAARLRTRSKNRDRNGERSIQSEAIIRKIVSISHWLGGVRQPLAAGLRLARPKRKIETAAKHGEWEIPKENRHNGSPARALRQLWIGRR
jgi:hypothetical protein